MRFDCTTCYNQAGSYFYRDAEGQLHEIRVNESVELREPLAPTLLLYGLRDVLVSAQAACDELSSDAGCNTLCIFAYLDDSVICEPRAIAGLAFTWSSTSWHLGLEFNLSKTHLWTPSADPPPGALDRL